MGLDSRLEGLFKESVLLVDSFLSSLVPGLEYPVLELRDGVFASDDFIKRYSWHLGACSKATRRFVLDSLFAGESDGAEAFVMTGLFDKVYYTGLMFENNSCDTDFRYTFCHEVIHARHGANYSLYKSRDPDALLRSFVEQGECILESEERDECLVDCVMSEWFKVEENRLTSLVRSHGLAYVWRMALDHKRWGNF